MTFRQQAEQMVSAARHLREADAIDLLEMQLRELYVKGQRSGIDEARRMIAEPMLQAAE